jgi:tetratricopeptide (TPR) repeat protein
MPTKLETAFRKFSWDSSRRAVASGEITGSELERALDLHVAGRYEDAIAEITRIPEEERSAAAWRVLGHAEHGRGNYDAAIAAHRNAQDIHRRATDEVKLAASDDEVNLAAVFISMGRYEDAWAATQRARELAPKSPAPWLPRISTLNRQGRTADLERELRTLVAEMPEFIDSVRFRDHLANDTDFIGVADMIDSLRSKPCAS